MFESIDQLEQEVNDFQKNILASTELVDSLETLVKGIKKQQTSFEAALSEVVSKMDTYVESVKSNAEVQQASFATTSSEITQKIDGYAVKMMQENNDLIEAVTSKCDALLKRMEAIPTDVEKKNVILAEEFQQCSVALQNATNEAVSQILMDNKASIDEAVAKINTIQQTYIDKLIEVETVLKQCEAAMDDKYGAFLTKLESTNVEQIFKTYEDIKKSLDTKWMLLSAGVGVSIILAIISFFVK